MSTDDKVKQLTEEEFHELQPPAEGASEEEWQAFAEKCRARKYAAIDDAAEKR